MKFLEKKMRKNDPEVEPFSHEITCECSRRNIRCPHVLSFPYFLKILCTTIFPNFPIKNHWTMKNCFSLINLDTNIKIYSKYRCTIIYFQEYFWSIVLDFRFRILTITILQFLYFSCVPILAIFENISNIKFKRKFIDDSFTRILFK